jgi:hypothetical protein
MTHEDCVVLPANEVLDQHICIRVGASLKGSDTEPLAFILGVFRRRFPAGMFITLGSGGPGPLEPKVLAEWMAKGLIDQSICSEHESLVLNDLVDAVIRRQAMVTVFLDADKLLCSPARGLKFIVEHLGAESGSSLSADAWFLQVGKQALQDIPKQQFPVNWREGLWSMHAACSPWLADGYKARDWDV